MNNPSPLIPQGSLLEQKTKRQSRVKLVVFAVLAVHVLGLTALLLQGCKREQPAPPPETVVTEQPMVDTNLPPLDTNMPPYITPTSAPPSMVETPVAAPAPTVTEYTILKGDTFFGIAKKFGVTMKAVQDANPGVEPTKLKVGQKIVIPAATEAPVAGAAAMVGEVGEQTYVVKAGDTLTKIASQHGTTVKALRAANGLTTDRIKVGDKLKIPAKAETVAPAPVTSEPAPVIPPPVTAPPPANR